MKKGTKIYYAVAYNKNGIRHIFKHKVFHTKQEAVNLKKKNKSFLVGKNAKVKQIY